MTNERRRRAPRIRKALPPGSTPGHYKREKTKQKATLRLVTFGEGFQTDKIYENVSETITNISAEGINWISVEGNKDYGAIIAIGEHFKFHKLSIEDVIDEHQPAKFDQYPESTFIVMRILESIDPIEIRQLSIFVHNNVVVTFQHAPIEALNRVRDRIALPYGRVKTSGVDYLVYALMDAVIDTYFPALEKFAEQLDEIDTHLLDSDTSACTTKIHGIKGELMTLRRIIWSHHDLMITMQRESPDFFKKETVVYMRDCLDHTKQQLELAEIYREVGANLMDLAFSNANLKANEIMKVLTVIASIFIPLTFITGVYGMNFNTEVSPLNMPELNWRGGYIFALSLMGLSAGSFLLFFRRKKWL